MTYKGYLIVKVKTDLGADKQWQNCEYHIFDKNGRYINNALTLSNAKEYIASGFNSNYLS